MEPTIYPAIETTKLFLQLGIAGAILFVLWRMYIRGVGLVEKLMDNHLTHIELGIVEIKESIKGLTNVIIGINKNYNPKI